MAVELRKFSFVLQSLATSPAMVLGTSTPSWYLGPFADDAAAEAFADERLPAGGINGLVYLHPTGKFKVREGGVWAFYDAASTASAAAAAASEAAAEADKVQTGLDRTQTGLDRTQTGQDRTATGLDAAATAADRVQTGLDKVATAADRVQTGLDKVATAADRVQTGLDRTQTGLDRVQTGLDKVATAADRVQTGLDAAATAADRVVTTSDKAATAADRVQTNLDKIDTAASRDLAYTYSQNAASAVAYQNLAAIARNKAVTAVDVFVYDTSKDSDGGAWRDRVSHTSWYNETLGTATRGARKDFPAVAVIVAAATSVTIYDGDDPTLPMWMVINQATSPTASKNFWRTNRNATALFAMNGVICIATDGVTQLGNSGVPMLYMVSDTLRRVSQNASHGGGEGGNIALRNSTSDLLPGSGSPYIVNPSVNDVAMTVLPDAPIDLATGLPVPTIAVATAGGLSVIKDDGTVVSTNVPSIVARCAWNNAGKLFYCRGTSSPAIYVTNNVRAVATNWTGEYVFNNVTPIVIGDNNLNNGVHFAPEEGTKFSYAKIGAYITSNGLGRMSLGADVATSMQALVYKDYNSGWMVGSTKGAWLSSKDTASLVAAELVSNGDNEAAMFSTSPATTYLRFSAAQSTDFARSGTQSAKITSLAVGAQTHVVFLGGASSVGANEGVSVKVWVYIPASWSGAGIKLLDWTDGSWFSATVNTRDTWTLLEGYRQPKGTVWSLGLGSNLNENVDGQSFYIDDISVTKSVVDDRSVNKNGLITYGTITRTPVASGTDLVGFGGFSASNYLEQPYNSALDFGTGDFCVMGWLYDSGASFALLSRTDATSGASYGPNTLNLFANAGQIKVRLGDGEVFNATTTLGTDTWRFLTFTRRSGTFEVWDNGQLLISVASTHNLTNAAAKLRVGQFYYGGAWTSTPGPLALLRISATAPSADQIRQIYLDERSLFQVDAQACLYGTSDAVTALGYDPDTRLLHVGSSSGRSVFQGLNRVSNTTTAVTAAISAANNLVAEQ